MIGLRLVKMRTADCWVLFFGLWCGLQGIEWAKAADQPQWGEQFSRNMISAERGLPESFDLDTGRNVKWSAPLGTECYATPVVAGGKVYIGTNNNEPRDPRHVGDRGVLLCLNESDGSLAWQLVVPKMTEDIYLDWPAAGMCSPPTVEGDRVYMMTNRTEVVCLDPQGMANGNDGPYRDEGRHMSPAEEPAMEVGATDADILWLLDLRAAAGVHPHDASHSSILIDGKYLYVNTSNGVNNKHHGVAAPEAPSLVVVDKTTGQLVAQEQEHISERLIHGTWSSPALGEMAGRRLIFFCGGDGVCYAYDVLKEDGPLHCLGRYDGDPNAPKENVFNYMGNRRESPSNIKSMPVFYNGRLYLTLGGDIWWGKNKAWLQCVDAGKICNGEQTEPLWSYPVERHCCSTPSIQDGLVYVADCGGNLHCVDAETGKPYWVHDAKGEMWASTLVADGKVYIGTRKGDFWVLAAGKEKKVLSCTRFDSGVVGTAVAANGTLYISTMTRIYAMRQGCGTGREP